VLRRKKYRFLALAYRTFLAGMVLTILTFVVHRFGLLRF
jgi:hypothetical protein